MQVKPNRCPACKRLLKRSSEANRRYWSLLHAIAEKLKPGGLSYSSEQWHLYMKSRFLGCDEFRLPNTKTIIIPKSSADLDVAEFNEFMTAVESWAGERDVYLADLEGL